MRNLIAAALRWLADRLEGRREMPEPRREPTPPPDHQASTELPDGVYYYSPEEGWERVL